MISNLKIGQQDLAPEIRTILETIIATLHCGQTDPEDDGNVVALSSYLNSIRNGDEAFKRILFFEARSAGLIQAHVLGPDSSIVIVPLTVVAA